ncbi:MAG: hypothetical protein LAO78_09780 [Acidobacteriia bacterium]|nr:hypothetical protein [Terriglobia bacterium]
MSWLATLTKSVSAKIEGKNVAVAILVGFSAFAVWIGLGSYAGHPILSTVLTVTGLAIVVVVTVALLLIKPQPSEISEKALVIKRDLFWAEGMQTSQEIVEILREAHNIRDLPEPVAIVKGSATNPADYHPISSADAAQLVRTDHDQINQMLSQEGARIIGSISASRMAALRSGKDASALSTTASAAHDKDVKG